LQPIRNLRSSETVVLVHALWLRGLSMFLLARRIARRGFDVDYGFSYASVRAPMAVHAQRLGDYIARLRSPRVHLVGHSMGTLVILKMLAEHRDPRIGRVVLLGPPFHGSLAGRVVGSVFPGRVLLGRSYPLWSQQEPVPPPRDVEVGVIAGTRGLGAGLLLGVLDAPHDGVVMLRETRVPGARDRVELPVSHTAMILVPAVARQVCAFLEHGRFDRSDRRSAADAA
jgi:pimeloyl-ACP methyl ester carboxylesterase